MSEEKTTYPIDSSLGGDNTCYVACEFRARQQNYAICLNVIKAYDEKRRKADDICCSEIKKKICPALKMREEEISAGHTLYYIPRKKAEAIAKPVEQIFITPEHIKRTDGYQRGWSHAGNVIGRNDNNKVVPIVRKPQVVKPAVKQVEIHDGSMASLISQMAKDHAAGVVEVKKEVVQSVKVETVLEKARRLREQREMANG